MGILYRQEEDGYKHIIEVREVWHFADRKVFDACIQYLTDIGIPYSIDYEGETKNINIPKAKLSLSPATLHPDVVKDNDMRSLLIWLNLWNWKCKAVRPNKEDVITQELIAQII